MTPLTLTPRWRIGRHPKNWYPARDYAALKSLLEEEPSPVGATVEVGCWTGQSTELIAKHRGTVLAVDPWGDLKYADRPDPETTEAYEYFLRNTRDLPIWRFRCGWNHFFEIFDGPLGFLHIDGIHEYDHVKDNILAALPYMTPGGIICGHDYGWPEVKRAVDEVFPERGIIRESWVWSMRVAKES